nr:MAG TPA: DNA-binding response regulator [Caudoviricetes sp.]
MLMEPEPFDPNRLLDRLRSFRLWYINQQY